VRPGVDLHREVRCVTLLTPEFLHSLRSLRFRIPQEGDHSREDHEADEWDGEKDDKDDGEHLLFLSKNRGVTGGSTKTIYTTWPRGYSRPPSRFYGPPMLPSGLVSRAALSS